MRKEKIGELNSYLSELKTINKEECIHNQSN